MLESRSDLSFTFFLEVDYSKNEALDRKLKPGGVIKYNILESFYNYKIIQNTASDCGHSAGHKIFYQKKLVQTSIFCGISLQATSGFILSFVNFHPSV